MNSLNDKKSALSRRGLVRFASIGAGSLTGGAARWLPVIGFSKPCEPAPDAATVRF
jgi:hypothetical protein